LAFQQWKNFENPLRIDKVIAMSSVCSFFGQPCIRFDKMYERDGRIDGHRMTA